MIRPPTIAGIEPWYSRAMLPAVPSKQELRSPGRRPSGPRFCAALMVMAAALTGCNRETPTAVVPPTPPHAPSSPGPSTTDAAFVGSGACVRCHEPEVRAWKGSHHDLAMQQPTDSTVLGDFNNTTFTYHGVTTTFSRKDGKFHVRTDGPDGALHDYDIAYTFGVYPLQQYLIRFPDGRLQALNVCWDTRSAKEGGQRWFHLYPNENVGHDDILHWTGPYQNWNFMCAECHSTDVHKNYNAEADTFNTTWSEINVACESCHGPASRHVEWADAKAPGATSTPTPPTTPEATGNKGLLVRLYEEPRGNWVFDTTTGIAKRDRPRTDHTEVESCARCHSRRGGAFSDDYPPGKPLADSHRLALLEAALYECDGQIKDEVYEYGSFLQSKMYAAGVTCTDCHNPHSLRVLGDNNTCARCHLSTKFDTPEHHKHAQGTQAAKCVSCHMPTRNYMVVHARHDHSFRVPRPDLTVKTGVRNACNGCHTDQSAQWAADAAVRLWGPKRAETPHYGVAFDAARRTLPGAQAGLLKLIDDPSQPAIVRASAIEDLTADAGSRALPSVESSLRDPDPQVRAAAARSLRRVGPTSPSGLVEWLAPLLSDPIREVRMDAARTLATVPNPPIPESARAAYAKSLDEYRASEQANADRPEARINLGVLAQDLGDPAGAEREYRAAIRVAPRFAASYVNLADLFRAQGKEKDAEQTLRDGLTKAPNDAGLHHALGLSLVRQKRTDEALTQLRLAAEAAPDNPRFAYVYAVALDSAGQRAGATAALKLALDRHPGDRDILAALASYAAEDGRFPEAVAYADRLVAAAPGDPDAIAFRNHIAELAAGRRRSPGP